jgi:DtxR family transcriptional regulator, Mn-dependent transcriptional regulator
MVKTERERNLGKATGDILKAIHTLQGAGEKGPQETVAQTSEIAARTGTSSAFVTKMLQSMERQGLIAYAPYRGAQLTQEGTRNAVELARHHRLLERFLTDYLGFTSDAAHLEAERMEHVISEEFEERLAAFMGHPTTCPHGAPIPNPDGTMPVVSTHTTTTNTAEETRP